MAKLTVLVGAPGSGKSTWAAKHPVVVTTDAGRGNGKAPGDVLHAAYKQINQHLAAGRDVVFDTTGSNPNVRKAAATIARKHGAVLEACVFDRSLQACLDAQKGRTTPVAEADVRRIHGAVQAAVPKLGSEGFQKVTRK